MHGTTIQVCDIKDDSGLSFLELALKQKEDGSSFLFSINKIYDQTFLQYTFCGQNLFSDQFRHMSQNEILAGSKDMLKIVISVDKKKIYW